MTEQLDLFDTSVEETTQEPKSNLTPRQWALYRLIKHNSLVEHRKTTQKEICDTLKDYGYEWNDNPKSHDHCSMIWKDVKDNNESYEHDKIIISDNFEYWIGNKEETLNFLDKLWSDISPRLVRYWAYLKKVGRDGQGLVIDRKGNVIDEDSQARAFIESYGKTRISD